MNSTIDDDEWISEAIPSRAMISGPKLTQLCHGQGVEFEANNSPFRKDWDFILDEDTEDVDEDEEMYDFETLRDKRILPVEKTFDELALTMTSVDDNGLVKKEIIQAGQGPLINSEATVVVHYQMFLEGVDGPFDSTRFRKRSCTFDLQEGSVILGLTIAVKSMRLKELSRFLIHWSVAFGRGGVPPRIPPEATILVEVEVLEKIEGVNGDALAQGNSFSEIITRAKSYHLSGNEAFKKNSIVDAIRWYRKSLRLLLSMHLQNIEEEDVMAKLKGKLHVNLAICYNKRNKPQMSCSECYEALSLNPRNSKALFQYGKAHISLSNFSKAALYLTRALKLEPNNTTIQEELKKLEEKQKEAKKQDEYFCKRFLRLDTNANNEQKEEQCFTSNEEKFQSILIDRLGANQSYVIKGEFTMTEKESLQKIAEKCNAFIDFGVDKVTFTSK